MSLSLQKVKFARLSFFVVGLFLLLFLPLEFFNDQILRLYLSEKEIAQVDLKDRLLQEISDFQADLKPEVFLLKNLTEFEKKVILGSIEVAQNNGNPEETLGKLDCQKFNQKLESYFVDRFDVRPFFIVSTDRDFSKPFLTGAERIRTKEYTKDECAELLLDAGLHLSSYKERKIGVYDEGVAQIYRMSEKIFSTYHNSLLRKGLITKVLSDHYNFQNLYLYHQKLEKDGQVLGFYSIGFREEDIDIHGLQRFALDQAGTEVSRSFVKAWKIDKSRNQAGGFYQNDRKIGYLDDVSAEFAALNRTHQQLKKIDPVTAKLLVSANLTENVWLANLLKINSSAKKALFLMVYAIFIWAFLNDFHFSLQLRRKFMLIAAAVMLPPTLLLSIFLILTSEQIRTEKFTRARNKLQKKLHKAELLLKEDVCRQSLSILAFKEHLKNLKPAHFLPSDSLSEAFSDKIPKIRTGLLYNRFGKMIPLPFFKQLSLNKFSSFVINDSIRFLNNICPLDNSKKEVRAQLERLQYTDAFIGEYYMLIDDLSSILSEEILNVTSINQVSPLSRMNFFLLPDQQTDPVKPWVFGHFSPPRNPYFVSLLRRQKNFLTEFLHQIDADAEYFVNFAERDTQIISEMVFRQNFAGWPDMLGIFYNAMEKGSSGSRTLHKKDRIEIHMWLFNETSAYIIAGVCYLKKKRMSCL